MIVLPITLSIAGAAALINIWIAMRVSALRRRHNVLIGDGGNEALAARMRAHSNFAEYTPFFLILLGVVELAEGSGILLWVVAILFVIGRILHVFGMDRRTVNSLRMAGIGLTMLSLLGLAVYAIALPYLKRMRGPEVFYAQALQAPASAPSDTNGLVLRS
jgi:uncharacterized membrane protein YecN with MAPEG domain